MNAENHLRQLVIAGHEGSEQTARDSLDSVDPAARQLALGALHRMGKLTDADVRVALTDAAAVVRRRAASLAATRPAISVLSALLDEEATVVETAAWAAGEQESVSDDMLARLIDLALTAPDPLPREAAVAALGVIGDERGLPAILAGCADKPNIRRRAVLALAPFSGAAVDAALAAALIDRDWQVRQAAEDLLPHMTDDPENS